MASPYWENTVFLVVADHDSRVFGKNMVPIGNFHIPGLILGGGIESRCSGTFGGGAPKAGNGDSLGFCGNRLAVDHRALTRAAFTTPATTAPASTAPATGDLGARCCTARA